MYNLTVSKKTSVESLKLLADFWTLRLIDELKNGELRYCELQRRAESLNPATLTSRLKKLERAGIIERKDHTCDKISVSYSLTRLGLRALPILQAINLFPGKTASKL